MRKVFLFGLLILLAALQADAKSFIYSYRGTSEEDAAVHTCMGTLADGKVTSREMFTVDDVKMRRAVAGASGDIVVFNRLGGALDWFNLKTMKLSQAADNFQRPVFISSSEMVYLAKAGTEGAVRNAAVLKRCVFADGACATISDKIVLEQLPQQFAHEVSQPLDVFWGLFLVDKKKVLGNVELASGKFTSVAEMPADAISNDISPDGTRALIGVIDFDPAQGVAKGESMAVELVLIDTKTGKSAVLVRSLHQQVPGEGNVNPRFTALFTDNDHIVYPETVIKGDGEISFQRLVAMDLPTKKTAEVGSINDASRLVNAVPLRTKGGDILWGEFKLDPKALKLEKFDASAIRGYSVSAASELVSNGKTISYLTKGMPVWGSQKTVAFIGSPEKDGKPGLYVYEVGSEKAVRVNSEDTAVVDFKFFD